VSTYFLATPLEKTNIDSSNRPSMAGSRDSSDISPSNIIEPTWETLPADEQLQFEEHKEQIVIPKFVNHGNGDNSPIALLQFN
jgi:hypothetical protein